MSLLSHIVEMANFLQDLDCDRLFGMFTCLVITLLILPLLQGLTLYIIIKGLEVTHFLIFIFLLNFFSCSFNSSKECSNVYGHCTTILSASCPSYPEIRDTLNFIYNNHSSLHLNHTTNLSIAFFVKSETMTSSNTFTKLE